MRVNVYAEEMTDRIEIISKEIDGQTFTAVRFYLELPVTVPCPDEAPRQVRGPFMHRPGDDDSAAVTFWGKQDLRVLLRKALALLDSHYGPSSVRSLEHALLDAVAAALPILQTDRETTLDCATLKGPDGKPDLSTLDEATKPFVAEYDRAIALCEDALQKAGLR